VPSRPEIKTQHAGIACKLCANTQRIWQIHYPLFVYTSGDFEAPPWFAHEKYYCPRCHFLWTDCFDGLSLSDYGVKYTENNYEHQRRPTEPRMAFAPWLLAWLVRRTGGRRFLDYGCGYNYPYIFELRSRGFDLWGCDISAAVPYSRYIRRLPDENLPDAFLDGLFSIDVMEHIADFDVDFRNMTRMLRPGGLMLHNTISLDRYWKHNGEPPDDPMTWAPWHCSVFSSRSADVLARRVGLEFCGTIVTPTDTGMAFAFRKPGPVSLRRFNVGSMGRRLLTLWRYQRYFRRMYTIAPRPQRDAAR
jgi:SAM-dependent methyltransferase